MLSNNEKICLPSFHPSFSFFVCPSVLLSHPVTPLVALPCIPFPSTLLCPIQPSTLPTPISSSPKSCPPSPIPFSASFLSRVPPLPSRFVSHPPHAVWFHPSSWPTPPSLPVQPQLMPRLALCPLPSCPVRPPCPSCCSVPPSVHPSFLSRYFSTNNMHFRLWRCNSEQNKKKTPLLLWCFRSNTFHSLQVLLMLFFIALVKYWINDSCVCFSGLYFGIFIFVKKLSSV